MEKKIGDGLIWIQKVMQGLWKRNTEGVLGQDWLRED